ncbi:unnamed protein product [Lota lota]
MVEPHRLLKYLLQPCIHNKDAQLPAHPADGRLLFTHVVHWRGHVVPEGHALKRRVTVRDTRDCFEGRRNAFVRPLTFVHE